MNNSALAQIEGGSGLSQRKYGTSSSNGPSRDTGSNSGQMQKIYNQKHHKTQSNNLPSSM